MTKNFGFPDSSFKRLSENKKKLYALNKRSRLPIFYYIFNFIIEHFEIVKIVLVQVFHKFWI